MIPKELAGRPVQSVPGTSTEWILGQPDPEPLTGTVVIYPDLSPPLIASAMKQTRAKLLTVASESMGPDTPFVVEFEERMSPPDEFGVRQFRCTLFVRRPRHVTLYNKGGGPG